MGSYILRRFAMTVPVLFGVTIIVFLVISLVPGDPAKAILGTFATPENMAQVRRSSFGLAFHRFNIRSG